MAQRSDRWALHGSTMTKRNSKVSAWTLSVRIPWQCAFATLSCFLVFFFKLKRDASRWYEYRQKSDEITITRVYMRREWNRARLYCRSELPPSGETVCWNKVLSVFLQWRVQWRDRRRHHGRRCASQLVPLANITSGRGYLEWHTLLALFLSLMTLPNQIRDWLLYITKGNCSMLNIEFSRYLQLSNRRSCFHERLPSRPSPSSFLLCNYIRFDRLFNHLKQLYARSFRPPKDKKISEVIGETLLWRFMGFV